MLAVPIFDTVTTCEVVLPTVAFTERLVGVTAKEGNGSATPTQPEIQTPAARMQGRTIATNTLRFSTDMSIDFSLVQVELFQCDTADFGFPGERHQIG